MTDGALVPCAIRRYSAGEISAMKAADLLGAGATVADVFVMTRQAGLPLPRPPAAQEQAELADARKILGLPAASRQHLPETGSDGR